MERLSRVECRASVSKLPQNPAPSVSAAGGLALAFLVRSQQQHAGSDDVHNSVHPRQLLADIADFLPKLGDLAALGRIPGCKQCCERRSGTNRRRVLAEWETLLLLSEVAMTFPAGI